METLPRLECNGKMETDWSQKIYKKQSKTSELPFAHTKQNMKLHEFTTTGIKNTNREFKLYTIGNNLKRIYNKINKKKQLKIKEKISKIRNTKFVENFASHLQNLKKILKKRIIKHISF